MGRITPAGARFYFGAAPWRAAYRGQNFVERTLEGANASIPGPAEASAGSHYLTDCDPARVRELQQRFRSAYPRVFGDPTVARTVVVVPSLSLDQDVMARVPGAHHYEERMLCLLLLLRLPRTRVIYVTSMPIPDEIIDYYLHLLPGVPGQHARSRLILLSCHDSSPKPLSAKILSRPRLMRRIVEAIPDPMTAHMSCFIATELEWALALKLGIPIYGCDPAVSPWGSKSGSRKIFREAGVAMPAGFEDLRDADDIAQALAELKATRRGIRRAVVKLNEGFSGEGNAIFDFSGAPECASLASWVSARLPALAFEGGGMTWDVYLEKFRAMGGIVEEFIEGAEKRSPSAQFRVDPLGKLTIISTHDQVLGGGNGQIFLGCRFPASAEYRLAVQEQGLLAARALAGKGVLGRFGIDFLSVREGEGWRHYAIEINIRKGGTTHPFLLLQFLTEGGYDSQTGLFKTPEGKTCSYFATDNLKSGRYRGLTPADLVDIATLHRLRFDAASQEGVAFHLIGALSQFGKLGVVCIGETLEHAEAFYKKTVEILDKESAL